MEEPSTGTNRQTARHLLAACGVAALVLAVDQITKWLVAARLGPDAASHRVRLLGDLLAFTYVQNAGIAFGLLQGQVILVIALAIVVVFLLVQIYRHAGATSWSMAIGCGLIVGGALGNLIDRARLGYVVDFVQVSAWPKFNVADSAITIGALVLAWRYLRDEGRKEIEEREPEPGSGVPSGLVALKHDGDR